MRENKIIRENNSVIPNQVHFEPKRAAKKNNATLMIDLDKNIFEYSFIKRKPRAKADIVGKIFARNFAATIAPIETIVTVLAKLSDIECVQYNDAQNTMMVVGKFSAMYINNDTKEEVVREYNEDGSCFLFNFD